MVKKITFLLFIFGLTWPGLARADVPQDFEWEYENTAGRLSMGTVERITVKGGQVLIQRDAKQLGEGPDKKQRTQAYPVTPSQMELLVKLIESSGFMNWPPSPELSHQSHADEYIKITMNGKTVRHTKWEQAHQEAFRILFTHFNKWLTDVKSVRF